MDYGHRSGVKLGQEHILAAQQPEGMLGQMVETFLGVGQKEFARLTNDLAVVKGETGIRAIDFGIVRPEFADGQFADTIIDDAMVPVFDQSGEAVTGTDRKIDSAGVKNMPDDRRS